MKSALFLASIALVLQLCPSFVINNGPSRLVGEFELCLTQQSSRRRKNGDRQCAIYTDRP